MTDTANLHAFSQHILAAHPVRKSKAQKEFFRSQLTEALQSAGWPVQVQATNGIVKSNNIIAGNLSTAKLIITAHYDTPAVLPFPNFIAPRNTLITLAYQILLAFVAFAIPMLVSYLLQWLWGLLLPGTGMPVLLWPLITWGLLMATLLMVMAGPANKSNVNDNTSGVLTLWETAFALPPELRGRVALVFFDNEELGLLGSAAFKKQYGQQIADATLINFDCVGDGDNLLFVQPATCRKDAALQTALHKAFVPSGGKQVILQHKPFTSYPSDQAHFARGMAVAALHKAPVIGLYVGRIHTKRDTVLMPENILLLRAGIVALAHMDIDA